MKMKRLVGKSREKCHEIYQMVKEHMGKWNEWRYAMGLLGMHSVCVDSFF